MKTTIEIGDALFEEAAREAQQSGTTLRELIETGLRRVLDERARKAPFELRDARNKHARLQPGIHHGSRFER